MSTPSALTVTYPPSFQNSFWSYPSYRPGAQSLYSKLQQGLDENESILAFVAHRAELEYSHAEALATPQPQTSFPAPLFKQAAGILSEVLPIDGGAASSASTRGFAANTSATSRAFRMIQAETNTTHANAHGKVARHLEKSILEPFGTWAADHRERVTQSWQHVDATLARFERQKAEVDKLKHNYENKCRAADEAEDDAKFAPIDESETHSPTPSEGGLRPPGASQIKQRSVSGDSTKSVDSQHDDDADPDRIKRRETIRKQFGFSQRATSANHSTAGSKTEVDGVKLPPLPTETEGEAMDTSSELGAAPLATTTSLRRTSTISALVHNAVEKMPAPLKAAVGGIASAEPRHTRLRRDADNAEKVYEESVRNLDRTRCQVEEVLFEHYGLTQRWEADRIRAVQSVLNSYNQAVSAQLPILHQSSERAFKIHSGLDASLELRALIRQARTGPFHPAVERFQPYYHDEVSLGRKAGPNGVAHGWLVKNGGFGLDLSLVERLEYLERLEQKQSGAAAESESSDQLAILPPVLVALLSALDRAYADDERWTKLAQSITAPTGEQSGEEKEAADAEVDPKIVGQEKRKTWILEVPLPITHRLRDALIAHLNPSLADLIYGNGKSADGSTNPIPDKLLDSYDAPVLAACVKVWLLELEHSLITEDLWDQIDAIYRAAAGQEHEALISATPKLPSKEDVGAEADAALKRPELDEATRDKIRAGVIEDLRVVLGKLPRIHLACLDALFNHLRHLLTSITAAEPDSVYSNKLGLALGRALLRPRRETAYTVTSQIGTLVVVDLLTYYEEIFPEVMEKKRKEKVAQLAASPSKAGWQRPMPIRKRTKPVDQRISRSSIGSDLQQGAKKLIEQMHAPAQTVPAVPEDKAQPAPPSIVTSTNPAALAAKEEDNLDAPTPLQSRMLSSPAPEVPSAAQEAETVSIHSEKAEAQQAQEAEQAHSPQAEGADSDRPISNVARLSRQFNSANLGNGGGGGKRTSMGGVVRGPRPAGARAARMSGQFSSSSAGAGGSEDSK